jgi:hypothetical protein
MNTSKRSYEGSPDIRPEMITSRGRIRSGFVLTFLGLLVFLIGARPALFGLDRSPVVGFIQIAVFLVGLAMICLGGYISLNTYWRNGDKTIVADIGLRLVSTGYVIAAFAGMADVFGFGGQPWPNVPFFGIWQATGVEIGQAVIAIGFLMMLPFRRNRMKRAQE